jgi:hypothetical protein
MGVLLMLLGFAGLDFGNAQGTSRFCNNWLIAGVYGFTIEGTKLQGPGPVGPQVGVALTEFDGQGGLQQIDSVAIDGVQTANFSETPTRGTYSVNADCTGTFTLNFTDGRPTVTTYFVVVDNGNEIDTMVKGVPPGVAGVIATRSIGKRRFTFGEIEDRVWPDAAERR